MPPESAGSPAGIRVLIVDDHPAVRTGLTLLLEPKGISVCGQTDNLEEALACLNQLQPDVVLVDLSLGDEDGSVLITELHGRNIPSLVYSMHEDGRRVSGAFAAGALGYVTKREVHRVLVQAISEVAEGKRFVSPRAALALAGHAAVGPDQAALSELSAQEQQVYRLLQEGKPTRAIAAAMLISPRTVESYCERMCTKLGLSGMRELRHYASKHSVSGTT